MRPICSRPTCTKRSFCHGLCGMHYERVRRTGDPGPDEPIPQGYAMMQAADPSNAFGARCPSCPGGGLTVIYDTTPEGRPHSYRCIALGHTGDRTIHQVLGLTW